MDFPGNSAGKESTCNAGDPSWIPVSGRSPGGGNDNPLQYSCLTLCNPMDCSPPVASVHGISQTRILEWVVISFSRGSILLKD